MNARNFNPRLYLMAGCPFCLKVRLFLLESRQIEHIVVREFVPGTTDEVEVRTLLSSRVDRVSFPAAELEPGVFATDSDAIIEFFAVRTWTSPSQLPTFQSYLSGVFTNITALYRENLDLKRRLSTG